MKDKIIELMTKVGDQVGMNSVIEMNGTSEILITGCLGITSFDGTAVVMNSRSGIITVSGAKLAIIVFRAENIIICGNIRAVTFGKEKNHA